MAQFKSPLKFKGIKEGKVFAANQPFEMSIKRAEEIQKNVKENYDIDLNFERLDAPENNDNEKENAPKENDKKEDKK